MLLVASAGYIIVYKVDTLIVQHGSKSPKLITRNASCRRAFDFQTFVNVSCEEPLSKHRGPTPITIGHNVRKSNNRTVINVLVSLQIGTISEKFNDRHFTNFWTIGII